MQKQTITEIQEIPTKQIQDNLHVRKNYDKEKLEELKMSLNELGELQPITVCRKNGVYELVVGSRRLLALKNLGIDKVSAIIMANVEDKTMLEMALTENIQRESLTPFEEASAIKRLIGEYGMKLKDVAKKIGRSKDFVRNRMQLLSLPEDIQTLVREKKLPVSAGGLATIKSSEAQKDIVKTALDNSLSEGELATLISEKSGRKKRVKNHGDITGARISLKIRMFSKFLDGAISSVLRLKKVEIILIKEVLRGLENKIADHAEELERCIEKLNKATQ